MDAFLMGASDGCSLIVIIELYLETIFFKNKSLSCSDVKCWCLNHCPSQSLSIRLICMNF